MSSKHFNILTHPRIETLRLMAEYLQGVLEYTDKMPESRNELTRFHAKSIPTIDIMAYLKRILKYAPCENDCFLTVLVYFNNMATLQNKPPSFVSSCKKRRKPIIINSYNIHRLLIIGIMIAAKFSSDIFFTNSHYAKVGGLPVLELNQLEIEFLLINDFDLHISVEEIQETGDLLINHKLKYPLKVNVNPTNDLKLLKHSSKISQSSQQQKDIPVPPRVTSNETEESGRRHSRQQSQPITSNRISNNHLQYNMQLSNSKRANSYDDYNRDMIDTTAAAIDSFDGEPIQKFTSMNSTSTVNDHRSPIPNVYTLQRTTSKSASAKLRNSLIMSMNSNIPLSSTNNNPNNSVSHSVSQYNNVSTINENSVMPSQNANYRYSYQSQVSMTQPKHQPQHQSQQYQSQHQSQQYQSQPPPQQYQSQPPPQQYQSQQPPQQQVPQQILQQNHYPLYQTPSAMPQPPPQTVLMDSKYNNYMYEQQQQQQQNEMMKKYNEVLRMSTSSINKPQMVDNNQYMMYKSNGSGMSYSTNDLYNPKRASNSSYTSSNLMVNANNGNPSINNVYKQPLKSKSSSSINVVNDWHNKELPPIKVQNKPNTNTNSNSNGNINSINNTNNNNNNNIDNNLPHHTNEILYQQVPSPQNPVPPMYTNSPIKVNTNPIISNNRLSVSNSLNGSGQFDSPLDAPPRLTKFFGYMPSEVVSPIKIADDYQQDLQKMEDMTNNFYLSPLNPSYSPSITQSFSNLHINTNVNSGASTPHRSYNSATPNGQNVALNNVNNIPSAHLNSAVDPSVSISPLANKVSSLSLSSIYNDNSSYSKNNNNNNNNNTNNPKITYNYYITY